MAALPGSGAPPFTPESLGAAAWYDPSDLSTLFQDSAGTVPGVVDSPVGKLNDKSGNGNHLTQATANARPTLRQSGPLYYLEFDGVDDHLAASFAMVQPWDRISAIRQITWTAGDHVFGGIAVNSGVLLQHDTGASPQIGLFDGTAVVAINGTLAVGSDGVVTERHDNANSRLAVNNGGYTSGTSGSTAADGLRMGAGFFSVIGLWSNVRVYGACMIRRALTVNEIADLRTYMGAKAGLVL